MDDDRCDNPPTPRCADATDSDDVIELKELTEPGPSSRKPHHHISKHNKTKHSSSTTKKHTPDSKRQKTNAQQQDKTYDEKDSLFKLNIPYHRHFTDPITPQHNNQPNTSKKVETKDASTNTTGVMKIVFGNPSSEFRIPDNLQPPTFTITYEL